MVIECPSVLGSRVRHPGDISFIVINRLGFSSGRFKRSKALVDFTTLDCFAFVLHLREFVSCGLNSPNTYCMILIADNEHFLTAGVYILASQQNSIPPPMPPNSVEILLCFCGLIFRTFEGYEGMTQGCLFISLYGLYKPPPPKVQEKGYPLPLGKKILKKHTNVWAL